MGETDWEGKLGLVLMGRAMLSKCLIPFSIDGWGCVPFLLFTWGQTMVEVMKIMVTSFKRSQACTTILSTSDPAAGHHRPTPPPETPRHSWQVWVSLLWVTAPFSWVSVHKLLLCPLRVRSPVLCKFWGLSGGLMATSSKSTYATPRSAAPRAPGPAAGHCWPAPPQETLTHGSVSVSVGPPGPGVHTACLSLWAPLVGMGFDSKCDFAPPTVLLGLFPWTRGVSSQLPQCHTGIKLPTSVGSLTKQKSSRKTSTSALLTMPKPLCGSQRRSDLFEKTLMLGKTEGGRRRGWQRMRWLDGITYMMDMHLTCPWEFDMMDMPWELVTHSEAWSAAVHGVTKSWTRLSDWTELNWNYIMTAKSTELFYLYCVATISKNWHFKMDTQPSLECLIFILILTTPVILNTLRRESFKRRLLWHSSLW